MTRPLDPRKHPLNILLLALLVADCLLAALALQNAASARTFLLFHIGFVALLFCFGAALYYARASSPDARIPWRASLLTLAALLLISLLLDRTNTTLVHAALQILQRRFQAPWWQAFGLFLSALIFLPLIAKPLRSRLNNRDFTDLAVCFGFLVLVALLYLPFGIDSIGHWESWIYQAHLEGRFSWSVTYELLTRFWVAVPHALALVISPDSFVGFHLTHLLILWCKLVCLYAILRQLSSTRLFAFLATALFLFYPVNSDLLSLRSLPNQYSALALMAAVCLALDYRNRPSRLHLLGIWLALSFNVASNETAFALILIVPLLWLPPKRLLTRRDINLTAIWFLAPLAKLAYLALLAGNAMVFYNSYVFSGEWNAGSGGIAPVISRLADVYRHTFFESWRTALGEVGSSGWIGMSAAAIILIGAIAWPLARTADSQDIPSARMLSLSLLGGVLLLIPSVGVLIWLEQYSGDLWRTYFYAPIGASVALLSLIALVASPLRRAALRNSAIIALALALCMPGILRLYRQQERLVASAGNKAILLRNLVEVVPQVKPGTVALLVTELTREELDATDFYEFQYSHELDDSILYVLYGNRASIPSHFCLKAEACSLWEEAGGSGSAESRAAILSRALVLRLNDDLSVDIVEDPAAYLGLDISIAYSASLLYDADAPLPPRAESMLGPAQRRAHR